MMSFVRSMAVMRRGRAEVGMSWVVSDPTGSPSTWGTVIGMKVMKVGWWLWEDSLVWVFVGTKKVILWPLSASLLAMLRKALKWPKANHGYIAICNGFSSFFSFTIF